MDKMEGLLNVLLEMTENEEVPDDIYNLAVKIYKEYKKPKETSASDKPFDIELDVYVREILMNYDRNNHETSIFIKTNLDNDTNQFISGTKVFKGNLIKEFLPNIKLKLKEVE